MATIDERLAGNIAREQAAAGVELIPKLTDDFLATLTIAAIACGREIDQAEVIGFALWCYEKAGREPPDFGRFAENG